MDLNNQTIVTCKIIKKEKLTEASYKKLIQEASLEISDNFIPKNLAFIEQEQFCFLIKEFIEGEPLDQYLESKRKRLRKKFAPHFFEKAFELIQKVHRSGYIHCDIKPSNFIVDENLNLHLIDFGLTQKNGNFIYGKTLFSMGFSPTEIILNHTSLVSEKSDYFNLGICLWYLFSLEIPLRHEHPAYMINLQITHPIPNHSKIPKKWFSIIEEICVKPSFPIPPNQMKKEERMNLIQAAIDDRPDEKRMLELIRSAQQI